MQEMKMPELQLGEKAEEIIFDNSEITTARITMRAYADPEGVARQREEGEWISIIRGEVSLRVGEKDVHLKGAQKTFVPSMTAVRIVESTDPCVLLSVLHK